MSRLVLLEADALQRTRQPSLGCRDNIWRLPESESAYNWTRRLACLRSLGLQVNSIPGVLHIAHEIAQT
jgi:hypothetical protein